MRTLKLFCAISAIIISLISCEENVVITGEFRPTYTLNCIIDGDKSTQIVTIRKALESEDQINTELNEFVGGAIVKLWLGDDVFFLRDSSFVATDSSGLNHSIQFYYTDNFQPGYGERVEIEALLPDGTRLESYTILPERVSFEIANYYTDEPANTLPGPGLEIFNFAWRGANHLQFYRPKYYIIYDKYFAYDDTRRKFEIPVEYIPEGESEVPVYAGLSLKAGSYFTIDAFERGMADLAQGSTQRHEFRIFYLSLELTVIDQFYGAYFSSSGDYNDQYSISLDKTDYTNIKGGLGIFGSKIKQSFAVHIESNYIKGYGYQPLLDD